MTTVRRLQAAAAFSAAVFAATCWQIGVATSRNRPATSISKGATGAVLGTEPGGMFATRPVLTYTAGGESFFAWQVMPEIPAGAARPRDIIVVVDTSASQAGLPLQNARLVIDELVKQTDQRDRLAIWTANTPDATHDLTRGLRRRLHDARLPRREPDALVDDRRDRAFLRAVHPLGDPRQSDAQRADARLASGCHQAVAGCGLSQPASAPCACRS